MKRIIKWIGIVLGALASLLLVVAVILYALGSTRLNRTYDIQVERIAVPTDEAAIARGQHLVEAVTQCQACHGANLAGDVLENEPRIATIYAPNLTAGQGGVGATFSDADFVRAIRHGVDPEGRGLLIMHADIFHNLSAQDLGAIIAYVRSVPAVNNQVPEPSIKPLGKILVALGVFDSAALPLIPAEKIDHQASFVDMPPAGPTAAYGEYLMSVTLCHICHGPQLTGGSSLEPGMPPGPDLTSSGDLGNWSEADFLQTIRSGVTPSGYELNPEFMPWDKFRKMTDDELRSLWLYLQSLPPKQPAS